MVELDFNAALRLFSNLSHKNFKAKTVQYYEFINACIQHGRGDEAQRIARSEIRENSAKQAFLALATVCLLCGEPPGDLLEQFESAVGPELLIALELSLRITLANLNSPRVGAAQERVNESMPHLRRNVRAALGALVQRTGRSELVEGMLDEVFDVRTRPRASASLRIAFVIDDLNPLKTATLTKMVFDRIAVLLKYTPHSILLVYSRLHAPHDEFWLPGIHQTRRLPLGEYLRRYDVAAGPDSARLTGLCLADLVYDRKRPQSAAVDVFVVFPFRHKLLEGFLYARGPVVEVELLRNMSSASNCDVLVPNGVPSQALLKAAYSSIALAVPPRRRFEGGAGSDLSYLKGLENIIVTVGKDFDRRAVLDIRDFATKVAELVAKQKSVAWVFVGPSAAFDAALRSLPLPAECQRRMVVVEYEGDLPALLRQATLYVQPPIAGGGRAPSIALENGCPAIALSLGDCTKYLPRVCQRDSLRELFALGESAIEDARVHENLLTAGRKAISGSVNEEAAICLEAAIQRAVAKFAERRVR